MHNVKETLQWYRTHEVYPDSLSFDPDGMCLAICRTARDLPAMYPSALSAQVSTPMAYRVYKIRDIRMGMVGYFDDPNDSNPYGHIITFVGRRKGVDPNSLSSLLCRTNSVKSNQIVVVRGDYFQTHWGDKFQFGATWLNGQPLTPFNNPPKPKPEPKEYPRIESAIDSLEDAMKDLRRTIRSNKSRGNKRLVTALERDLVTVERAHTRLENRLEHLQNS